MGKVQKIQQPVYDLTPGYQGCIAAAANDTIGDYLLKTFQGEPHFDEAASFLAPVRDYAVIGIVNSSTKWSISPDGRIKRADNHVYTPMADKTDTGPGILVFDPSKYVQWPATNFSNYKSALVGRYLRAVSVGAWDEATGLGYGLMAFGPTLGHGKDVLVRLATSAAYPPTFQYFGVSNNDTVVALNDGNLFYSALLEYAQRWNRTFERGMHVVLPGRDGQRQVGLVL